MSPAGALRRYAGAAGAAVSVIAAGAAAGILAEHKIVARERQSPEVPFGSLRGQPTTVRATDDLELYAEVDEPTEAGHAVDGPTIIFSHGYALNLDCWHFQRAALRGQHRMVFYDQRSHGRSGRSRREHATIDQLARDLAAVIDTLAADGPVILVGHSMGGMTIMALAEQHPEWFGSRVVGVALMGTSAGQLEASTLGLPGLPGRVVHKVSPAVMATLARAPRLVERGRRTSSDIGFVITRKLAFGGDVPQELVDFTDEMLAATPIEVIADFFPGFDTHDKFDSLNVLAWAPTVVIGGTKDAITPFVHTRRIAELVPSAELVELTGAGHMMLLERRIDVTEALRRLIEKSTRGE